MNGTNLIKIAVRALANNKLRGFLTMLGIIIGVTAVLVLVALVSGYNADITAYYEKLGVNKVNVTVNWYDTEPVCGCDRRPSMTMGMESWAIWCWG